MTPRFQHLASIVSSQFGVCADVLMSPVRTQSVASARFALYALCVRDGMSMHEVTTTMGKARGTIGHGIRQHGALLATCSDYVGKWVKCLDVQKGITCPHCGKHHTT